MKNTLSVSTAYGDVAISENELPAVTDKDLAKLRISREELHRCFAEGLKLMAGRSDSDRVRPVATETFDGKWVVHIVGYSPLSDQYKTKDGTKH